MRFKWLTVIKTGRAHQFRTRKRIHGGVYRVILSRCGLVLATNDERRAPKKADPRCKVCTLMRDSS